ncbi:MBL fold metallo-hydrolase [Citricoccus sp. NR2]|uniref:MBL fold metallo-hydrolase n=1 Tax=Citricoccus sp. NR2 TaxID=3004095 RepID=UPI0022DE595D|nr:MBL fold metallo-hydrolase [Citricoccus sp. NR2]WBL19755.1 MBL fold metallo-hydrolase [Citricoccus sp. NR2]
MEHKQLPSNQQNVPQFEIITLGVAAGPAIRGCEAGMSTAVLVDGAFYIVDFGLGCTRSAHESGLRGKHLRAGFITHLHSDHVAELPAFLMWNWGSPVDGFEKQVKLFGPGPDPSFEQKNPRLHGTSGMMAHIQEAFSYDLHIRENDESRPHFSDLLETVDLDVPEPGSERIFEVYRDLHVVVSAVLVDHPPVFPAVAYRFDTRYGSAVISGDTAESKALVALARDCDMLIHEAVNLDFYRRKKFAPAFIAHQANSHTPPEGAGRVAKAAGAKHLVLSHLAGQMSEDMWQSRAATTYSGPISVAHSGQRFTVASH